MKAMGSQVRSLHHRSLIWSDGKNAPSREVQEVVRADSESGHRSVPGNALMRSMPFVMVIPRGMQATLAGTSFVPASVEHY